MRAGRERTSGGPFDELAESILPHKLGFTHLIEGKVSFRTPEVAPADLAVGKLSWAATLVCGSQSWLQAGFPARQAA